MTKPGHIEMTDKVRFVYHELEKPDPHKFWVDDQFYIECYFGRRKRYEASKRTVEVRGLIKAETNISHSKHYKLRAKKGDWMFWIKNTLYVAKNNQKCKAEVNGKATIVELTK